MTAHELKVKTDLESQGYRVYHRGIPDFLCIRGTEIFFVEAKSGRANLSVGQKIVKAALEDIGIKVYVARDSNPIERPRGPVSVKFGNTIIKIYRNGGGKYPLNTVAYYQNGKRRRKTFRHFDRARAFANEIVQRAANGEMHDQRDVMACL